MAAATRVRRAPAPPMARGLPVLGNLFDYQRRPIDFLLDSVAAHGPVFRFRALGSTTTVVTGAEGEALVRGATPATFSRHRIFDAFDSEIGLEIFGIQGEEHLIRRRLVKMGYSRMVAAQFVSEMAERLAAHVGSLRAGSRIHLVELASELTTLATAVMLTPLDVGPLVDDVGRFAATVLGVVLRLRPALVLRTPGHRARRRRLERALDAAIRRHRAGAFADDIRMYMIDAFLAAEVEGRRLDERGIRGACLYALAGTHAYAGRLAAFMVYEMLRNPALLAAARQEADAIWSAGLDPALMRRMTTLRAAFHEALRVYPLLGGLPFRAAADLEVGGYRVPHGEMVLVTGIPGHFLSTGYDNPHAFDAGRCRAPRNEHRCPGAFTPFGIAPRLCAAGGMVELVTVVAVATLLRTWHLELLRPSYRVELAMRPLLSPADGLPVIAGASRAAEAAAADASLLLEREAPEDFLEEEWQELPMPRLEPIAVAAGEDLVTQGEPAENFFIILAGEASVWEQDGGEPPRQVNRLVDGQSFGEIGLLKGVPRTATVRADTEMRVLRLDRETFMGLISDSDLIGSELGHVLQERFVKTALANALPRLEAARIVRAAPDAEIRHLSPGEVVFEQGDAADALYIVLAGHVDVVREDGQDEIQLNRLGPGDVFGEIGILQRRPRTATVRAGGGELVELLRLERERLEEMVAESPAAAGDLALLMSRHLMNELRVLRENGR